MNLHLPCTYEYIWNTEFACKSVARSVHFYIWTTYEHGKQEPQNQQPTSTRSGAGEKETLNMNVVGMKNDENVKIETYNLKNSLK